MKIQEKFGLLCKKYREEKGISQEKFALKIGMDRTYYASVEMGKRNIAIVNIEKIINGLGVNMGQFFSEINNYNEEK